MNGARSRDAASKFLHADDEIAQNSEEKSNANQYGADDFVKEAWIALANHGNASLICHVAIDDNRYTYDRVGNGKVSGHGVIGSVEKGQGKRAQEKGDIQIRYPGSLICKPYFSFNLYRRRNLLGNANVGGQHKWQTCRTVIPVRSAFVDTISILRSIGDTVSTSGTSTEALGVARKSGKGVG